MVATFTPRKELQQVGYEDSKTDRLPEAQFGGPGFPGDLRVRIDPTTRAITMEPLDNTWDEIGISQNSFFAVEGGGAAIEGIWQLGAVVAGEERGVNPLNPPRELIYTNENAVSSDPIAPNRLRGVLDQTLAVRLSDDVQLNTNNHRSRGTLGETWASDALRQLTFDGAVSGLWEVDAVATGASSGAVGTVVGVSPGISQGGVGHYVTVDVGPDYFGAEFTLGEDVDSSTGASGTLRADALGARSISPLFRQQGIDEIPPTPPSPADYPALVLADMGAVNGSFFEMQDGTVSPLTDSGPDASVDMIAKDPGITAETDGPWPGSKGMLNDAGIEWRDWTANSGMFGAGVAGTWEGWFKVTSTGSQTFNLMLSDDGGRLQMSNSIGPIKQGGIDGPALPQPPDWIADTIYAQGARVSDPGLPGNVFEAEVGGTSDAAEPTWPALNLTVVDGGVTWRNAGHRVSWNNSGVFTGNFTPTLDEWFYVAFTRDAGGWKAYINGVHDEDMDVLVAIDNTLPGSFGTPKKFALSADYSPGSGSSSAGSGYAIGASGVDGEEQWHGAVAFVAAHYTSLTPAKILAHYDLGVVLGLNT